MPLQLRALRRSLGNFVSTAANRLRRRSFVPHPRKAISIETSARCNLACRFCAYEKHGPGGFMSDADFAAAVEQAVAMGIDEIWLTPMLGELFADPKTDARLQLLENTDGVSAYGFFSNFILPRPQMVAGLGGLSKLFAMHISIYGHDRESFRLVTRKPGSQFDKLIDNLSALEAALARRYPPGGVHFTIRTIAGISRDTLPDNELIGRLRGLSERFGANIMVADEYDTWAGEISPDDVREMGIQLLDGRGVYRSGACTLLFSGAQIAADGSVHACACRDVDGSLEIGALGDAPLRQILAWSNPRYQSIIRDHENGVFGANCRSCSMYRSIRDHRAAAQDTRLRTVPLERAIEIMSGATEITTKKSPDDAAEA